MNNTKKQVNLSLLLSTLFLGYVIVYIDKLSVGISIISISKDIPMTESQKGLILSAFFIGYAIMQVPMSFAINQFGAKKVLIWSVFMIGVFDFIFSFGETVTMLLAIRLLTGMLAHSGYPSASSKEIIDHFPLERRTFAKGILISSSGIAGIVGPILLSPIIDKYNWKFAYMLLTILAILASFIIARSIPTPNKQSNEIVEEDSEKVSLLNIWKNRNIWILFAAAFFVNSLLYGINNWLPSFLTSQRGITLTQSGIVSSCVGVFSLVGAIGGSYVVSKFFSEKDTLVIMIMATIGSSLVFLSYYLHSLVLFILVLGLATLSMTVAFVTLMTIPLKVFTGKHFAPSYSTISTGGILGGATAQIIIGSLVDGSESYLSAFIYFFALGILATLSLTFLKKGAEHY
ncbi:MFS transporter [Vagococcus luciliae]|uniref:Sulfoacetate transporter SauU n=1 Tax=Vagococcus luciliae TaxID=2920380 RepID=A0ABY5P0I4_9ENTE|nr:MFS transporter [Vagococcus luciliae]UUV99425.1 putative sulfoacetate transporter SauU [Vagococcus luciliae]